MGSNSATLTPRKRVVAGKGWFPGEGIDARR
jgi:hypothetical protein